MSTRRAKSKAALVPSVTMQDVAASQSLLRFIARKTLHIESDWKMVAKRSLPKLNSDKIVNANSVLGRSGRCSQLRKPKRLMKRWVTTFNSHCLRVEERWAFAMMALPIRKTQLFVSWQWMSRSEERRVGK